MSPRGFKLPATVGKAVKRLSKFLRTKPQSQNYAGPSIRLSPFNAVPFEIVEEILLHLPCQDIIRMKQVRWGGGGVNT